MKPKPRGFLINERPAEDVIIKVENFEKMSNVNISDVGDSGAGEPEKAPKER